MIPSTLAEWDRALSDYFLATGSDGDASDIRSFEVTTGTLAMACHVGTDKEKAVEQAFRKVLLADRYLIDILQNGHDGARGKDYPGYFVYLALTLFIDSLLDEYSSTGQFRERLARWLEVDHHFMNLEGVRKMWLALVNWLATANAAGKPFRRLTLPPIPKNWTHIGYTRRLSFPSRSDIRLVERFVRENSRELDSPRAVIDAFRSEASAGRLSPGLKDAFEEFENLFLNLQRRALVDHRFWRLMTRVCSKASPALRATAELFLTFNENGDFEFLLQHGHGEESHSFSALAKALADPSVAESTAYSKAIKCGVLFFYQEGIGRWRADAHWREAPSGIRLAITARHKAGLGSQFGQWTASGSWFLSKEPQNALRVKKALIHARLLVTPVDHLFQASLHGGVRVNNSWLGRARFLPTIISDVERVAIASENDDSAQHPLQIGPHLDIVAKESPFEGEYTIEPISSGVGAEASWRLRARFVGNAVFRPPVECARERLVPTNDWSASEPAPVSLAIEEELRWEEDVLACDDLLEALYADGACGWEEGEIVELVRRASDDAARDPWILLRCLQDAGIIVPRLRQGWRGRAWTLASPKLICATQGKTKLAIVEGALCQAAVDRFKKVAKAAGGTCFRRPGASAWSPPIIGVVGGMLEDVSETLGWPLVELPDTPAAAALALQTTERHAELYECSSEWDWWERRFLNATRHVGAVQLTRRIHPDGADHDVFRVQARQGKTIHFLSRTAAIVAAHALAQIPLFEFKDDQLLRLTQDGGLPDALATALRRRTLRAAGLKDGRYAYPASERDAQWLASLLPGCVIGLPIKSAPASRLSLSAARKSSGRFKPQWRDGRLILQP